MQLHGGDADTQPAGGPLRHHHRALGTGTSTPLPRDPRQPPRSPWEGILPITQAQLPPRRYSLAGMQAVLPAPLQGGSTVLQQRQQAAPQQEEQQLPDALGEVQDGLGHPGLELRGQEQDGVGELRWAPGGTGHGACPPPMCTLPGAAPSCWVMPPLSGIAWPHAPHIGLCTTRPGTRLCCWPCAGAEATSLLPGSQGNNQWLWGFSPLTPMLLG